MIETATSDDAAAVTALWRTCGLTRPWNDPAADFALALGSAAATVLVARDGAALAGTVMAGFDGHRGWVYYLAVAPAARGAGFGRALMAAAEAWLAACAAPKLQLMVRGDNAAAAAFYEAIGLVRQDVAVFGRFIDREQA